MSFTLSQGNLRPRAGEEKGSGEGEEDNTGAKLYVGHLLQGFEFEE